MSSTTLAATAPAKEKTLTAFELEQGRLFLAQTRNAIIGAIKGVSEQQWTFKPAPDQWSIAENMEHVLTVQEFVLGPRRAELAVAPPPPEGYDTVKVDAIIIHEFPTRLNKVAAPEAINPKGGLDIAEAFDRITECHSCFEEFLKSTPDLREHALEGAPLKFVTKGAYVWMDGYHWILAAAAHTERHAKQILEVKADPRYPEN